MELNLVRRQKVLQEKIPDIQKTLEVIGFMNQRRNSNGWSTTFESNDTLYAEADIQHDDTVYIWLGANVMLSYSLIQAVELLSTKLDSATGKLANTVEDLEYIREQITIMEVNTARCHNWDVKRQRIARRGGKAIN